METKRWGVEVLVRGRWERGQPTGGPDYLFEDEVAAVTAAKLWQPNFDQVSNPFVRVCEVE